MALGVGGAAYGSQIFELHCGNSQNWESAAPIREPISRSTYHRPVLGGEKV
jgi:hypothetical protein